MTLTSKLGHILLDIAVAVLCGCIGLILALALGGVITAFVQAHERKVAMGDIPAVLAHAKRMGLRYPVVDSRYYGERCPSDVRCYYVDAVTTTGQYTDSIIITAKYRPRTTR